MQHKTETDGEIQSWISEQARIDDDDDDDDIDAMYNTTMYSLIKQSQNHKNRVK